MREYEMMQALSGKNEHGHPKAGFGLYHEYFGSDSSACMKDELFIEKPEIRIFKDFNNMVRIDFIYESPEDADLMQHWSFLERFFQPENSAEFNEDEFLSARIANHEIFDPQILHVIDGEDNLSVELMNGKIYIGQADVELEESLSQFYFEWIEDGEDDEPKQDVISIQDVASLMLNGEELYSHRADSTEEKKVVLYMNALTLNIISLFPRGQITLTTKDNPLFYSLVPVHPNEPARILRMIFQKDDVLFEEISEIDARDMENSTIRELEMEKKEFS